MANEFLNRGRASTVLGGRTSSQVGDADSGGKTDSPTSSGIAGVDIDIIMPNGETESVGTFFKSLDFKGMLNGGYIMKAVIFDANFNTHNRLIEKGYFKKTRISPVKVDFILRHGSKSSVDQDADFNRKTRKQSAILTSVEILTKEATGGNIEITAIDPPSYYLSAGTATGEAYTGKISEVIERVVEKYAAGIKLDIAMTSDSRYSKWYMMRQDPKTFIKSILEWSSGLNPTRTNWIIGADGFNMQIKDQGSIVSKNKGLYRYASSNSMHTLRSANIISDHSLTILQTQLITHGASVISGKYWDQIIDENLDYVSVRDKTTSKKQIAKLTNQWQSFIGPNEKTKPPYAGFTSIGSVPEIDSSGGLGVNYEQYIDGRARKIWYDTSLGILNAKFQVLGHGIYSDTLGLGVDTIFIDWGKTKAETFPQGESPATTFWVTGNWLLYGFHHRIVRGNWYTDLYCSRYDITDFKQ